MERSVKRDILNIVPAEEQGSEANYGFHYQAHCITRVCLEMVLSHEVTETVCEHHEDFMQIRAGLPPRFCQVKKRESVTGWTIPLLKDAILKLFKKLAYKNVGDLVIYGHGRPSNKSDGKDGCSLAGLMALLDRPNIERNSDWDNEMQLYEHHLWDALEQKVDLDTVKQGMRLLRINLTMPHPEAIKLSNIQLTAKVVHQVWGVELSLEATERVYKVLYDRVCEASIKPKRPRSVKQIKTQEAKEILREALRREGLLVSTPVMLLNTQEKLKKGKLEEYLPQALEKRMDALQLKYELNLGSIEWQNLRDDISVAWEDFLSTNSELMGKKLWQQLRNLLSQQGQLWSEQYKNNTLGPVFAEGIFFDMMAICEVDIRA